MERFLLVCLGGALGSGARYLIATAMSQRSGDFPYGTLLVNLLGSFLIAAVVRVATESVLLSPTWRLFLTTGVLGGFTTYSAFSYDTFEYFDSGAPRLALINLGTTLIGCLFACFLGARLAQLLVRS